jgi:alanyl-tRNA synthetase
MTKRLYDFDSYLTEFSAVVVRSASHENKQAVILDQTAFYPASGGQPHDTGTLNGIPVLDVIEQDKEILHLLETSLEKDQSVTGRIDRDRRLDHMQQHTGQHILSQSFIQQTQAATIGFHMGAQICTIDLDRAGFSSEVILQVENAANRIVMENRAVRIHRVRPEEVVRFHLRKTPVSEESIRIVEIDGFDANGCCGTHVKSTGEVGFTKILRHEKYKGGTRVAFVCGFRALQDYQKKQRLTGEAAAILNNSEDEIIGNLERWKSDRKRDQKRLKQLGSQLVQFESGQLLAGAETVYSNKLILKTFPDRDPSELQQLARLLIQHEHTIALLGCADENAHLVLGCHTSLNLDMNEILHQVIPVIDGKGGGTNQLAQGNGPLINKVDQALSKAREIVRQALS